MKVSKENSEHYNWGDKCSGWHLVKSESLSVIEELMPPHTAEETHYHNFAEQFFQILKGTASFEIEDNTVEVGEGQGIHIMPQTIHRISNNQNQNLEFIVISRPTTRGDRINKTFIESNELNLNGKKFKSVLNSENGEVNSDTIFEYRQEKSIVWATYQGGDILFGTLSGKIANNELTFTYQHQNLKGEFKTGKCESSPEIIDGKLYLKESWEWTCDDFSKGESVIAEITTSSIE